MPTALPPPPRRRRTGWRELIKQVWGVDPLKCPLCSGLLRPIAVVDTAAEIHAVLAPLGLCRSHDRPFAHGPPVPEVTVLVAADSGAAYPVDPPRSNRGCYFNVVTVPPVKNLGKIKLGSVDG